MQDAQNGPASHPPTPVRQDAPFHRQGRSARRGESYSGPYVEPLSDARTPLAGFFRILPPLVVFGIDDMQPRRTTGRQELLIRTHDRQPERLEFQRQGQV